MRLSEPKKQGQVNAHHATRNTQPATRIGAPCELAKEFTYIIDTLAFDVSNNYLNLYIEFTMEESDFITIIVENIRKTDPDKIILFGSYANGNENQDSDIDILVVTKDNVIPCNYSQKNDIYKKVAETIADIKSKVPVDLIVHTRLLHKKFLAEKSLFAQQILSEGRVLYEKTN